MKRNILIFSLCLYSLSILFAQNPELEWLSRGGGSLGEGCESTAIDKSGNICCTGFLGGNAIFNEQDTLFWNGEADAFVWKVTESGDLLWVKSFSGSEHQWGQHIATDTNNNIYTSGWYFGTADFDPGPDTFYMTALAPHPSTPSYYVTKLSSSGDFMWAGQLRGLDTISNQVCVTAIDVDESANLYLTGYFAGQIDFDPGPSEHMLYSDSIQHDIFICKWDKDGVFVWAKRIGGIYTDRAFDLALDQEANIHLTGNFTSDTIDFDPGADTFFLTNPPSSVDIFVAKYNEDGQFIWAKAFNNNNSFGSLNGSNIMIDFEGNVITEGHFQHDVDFDPGLDTFYLSSDQFQLDRYISKLDSTGQFIWAKAIQGNHSLLVSSIATDNAGNIYSTGSIEEEPVDFDPGTGIYYLSADQSSIDEIFISKLDASGNFVWAEKFEGGSLNQGTDIQVDDLGYIYSCGYFQGLANFGFGSENYSILSNGGVDAYIHKLSQPCQLTANLIGNLTICSNNTATITAASGYFYSWNTGHNSQSISVTPDTNTIYTVTVSDGQGCSVSSYVEVEVLMSPEASIAVENPTICLGDSVWIFATGGTDYIWTTGEETEQILVSPENNTTYTVTVSNSLGCTVTKSIAISATDWSGLAISGDTTVCSGEELILEVPESHSYDWNTGETSAQITLFPTITTCYEVTLTDSDGCMGQAATTVVVLPLPEGDIEDVPNPICVGEPVMLSATGGEQYLWNSGETSSSITATLQETATVFTVLITGNNDCTAYDSIELIAIQPDTSIFVSDLSLTALADSSTFQWLDCNNDFLLLPGATSAQLTVIEDGAYAVQVTEGACIDTSTCYVIMTSDIIENETENRRIRVYPNPTLSAIAFDVVVLRPTTIQLQIFDLLGHQLVEQQQWLDYGLNQLLVVNVKNWESGLYFYTITADDGREGWSGKFVKE